LVWERLVGIEIVVFTGDFFAEEKSEGILGVA
jgi:hypothetical protein